MLKKIKLISNSICYGPPPAFDDEVEQRLSISSKGRITVTAYNYGGECILYKRTKVEPFIAQEILEKIQDGLEHGELFLVTDVGTWDLTAEYEKGEKRKVGGSLSGCCQQLAEVSSVLRECMQLPLYVFDGGEAEEEE